MINLIDCVEKYKNDGLDEIYANAKVCQDVILTCIFKSRYKNNITIKGGIVMFNLTNDLRRATVDIDIDLIRISIADSKIHEIFNDVKIRGLDIDVDVKNILELRHQDYRGKRIPIEINDTFGNKLSTKIDIGVHSKYNILQDELCFNTSIEKDGLNLLVNSKEQIFVEKIIPIIRFGAVTTRYKDFFDLYWLIEDNDMDKDKLHTIMQEKIFFLGINDINNINEIINLLGEMLNNPKFIKLLMDRKNNWLDIKIDLLRKVIIDYLNSLVTVEV